MNDKQIPELAFLLQEVARKWGRNLSTSSHFEALSVDIEKSNGDFVSSSTLKRLWGYVSLRPTPRIDTLDVLCRYIGFRDFKAFKASLGANPAFTSGFFTSKFVSSDSLSKGDALTIGWAPDRIVELKYLGEGLFRVESSRNSKLMEGDEFHATQFLLGWPLLISKIKRGEEYTPSFVAGKKEGLNYIELVKPKES